MESPSHSLPSFSVNHFSQPSLRLADARGLASTAFNIAWKHSLALCFLGLALGALGSRPSNLQAAEILWKDSSERFSRPRSVAFSPDGKTATYYGHEVVDVHSGVRRGPTLFIGTPSPLQSAAYSASGDALIYGAAARVSLVDMGGVEYYRKGEQNWEWLISLPVGAPSCIENGDNTNEVFVGVSGPRINSYIRRLLLDRRDWDPREAVCPGREMHELQWIPSRGILASASLDSDDVSSTVKLWSGADLSLIGTLTNRSSLVVGIRHDRLNNRLAAAFEDGWVIVWSTKDWSTLSYRNVGPIALGSIDFTRSGRILLVVGVGGIVRALSPESLEEFYSFPIDTDPPGPNEWEEFGLRAIRASPTEDIILTVQRLGGWTAFRLPLAITKCTRSDAGGLRLEWQGGQGPYMVQRSRSLSQPQWTDVGEPTPAQEIELHISSTEFIRVIAWHPAETIPNQR